VAGGQGGSPFHTGGGGFIPGAPGPGGAGGTGGTGSGTATKIIRRGGQNGANGTPAYFTGAGDTAPLCFGGSGGASVLGGSPGRGGSLGTGTAGAANSGAGGGGYGNQDPNGGSGGGGAGEYGLLRYATPAASYSYTVGGGGGGSIDNAIGGSGYIRIRCHFNF